MARPSSVSVTRYGRIPRRLVAVFSLTALFAACASTEASVAGGTPKEATPDADAGSSVPCPPETDLANDARHCGACGVDCGGGKCEAGRCQAYEVRAAGPRIVAITTTQESLYVATAGPDTATAGKILRSAKDGSGAREVATFFALSYTQARMFAEEGKVRVYMDNCCTGPGGHWYEESSGTTGHSGHVSGADAMTDAILSRGRLFVAARNSFVTTADDEAGARTYVAFPSAGNPGADAVAANTESFFASTSSNGEYALWRIPRAAAGMASVSPELLLRPSLEATAIAADGDALYAFVSEDGVTGTLNRIDLTTKAVERLADSTPTPGTKGVVVSGGALYWAAGDGAYRWSKAEGKVEKIARVSAVQLAGGVHLDGKKLYFTEELPPEEDGHSRSRLWAITVPRD